MYPQGPAAYDRAITVFSPDGRLFQVEYAREAVKRGTTAVGITYDQGVLLAVDKNIAGNLIVKASIEKIFQIDEHIAVATSGLVADARRLIEEARVKAQRNRLAYGEPIGALALTKDLCDTKQAYTQYGGARPFGTALLLAGVNEKPSLYETDPSGAFTEYHATAIGMGKREVEKLFDERNKQGQTRKEAIELALIGLNAVSEGEIKKEHIDMITIEKENRFSRVSEDEIGEAIQNIGSVLKETKKEAKEKGEE
ncbi:MAG: archaeal proteasome endopeptidase complex subunit alpha [Candidatus Altiarchaeota archaeon]